MIRGKPLRIEKELVFDASSFSMYLFCLPEAGRRVLLSACERLLWNVTWIDSSGNRVGLTDYEKSVIEFTIAQLSEGTNMNELIAVLEQINQILKSKPSSSASATATCNNCGGDMCNCGCNNNNQQQNQQSVQEIYAGLTQ